MNKNYNILSFFEKEKACEETFGANGPDWHLFTNGNTMQNIFCNEEDFKTGMWCLAAALHLNIAIRGITFELMSNHVHLILAGNREDCIKVFEFFSARLKQAFSKRKRPMLRFDSTDSF